MSPPRLHDPRRDCVPPDFLRHKGNVYSSIRLEDARAATTLENPGSAYVHSSMSSGSSPRGYPPAFVSLGASVNNFGSSLRKYSCGVSATHGGLEQPPGNASINTRSLSRNKRPPFVVGGRSPFQHSPMCSPRGVYGNMVRNDLVNVPQKPILSSTDYLY